MCYSFVSHGLRVGSSVKVEPDSGEPDLGIHCIGSFMTRLIVIRVSSPMSLFQVSACIDIYAA